MDQTVVKISDWAQPKENKFNLVVYCSRCNQPIKKEKILVKAIYERDHRQQQKIYIYHPKCIETSHISLKINALRLTIAWKVERIIKGSILKKIFKNY